MTTPALTALYQFFNAIGLLDGQLLNQFVASQVSATGDTVVTALAGGGATGPLVDKAYNRVGVCVTNNDSVLLPLAIPGQEVIVDNDGAATLAVFAQTANPNNAGAADKIVAQSSLISGGGAASVTQATGISTSYFCTKAGFWKAD